MTRRATIPVLALAACAALPAAHARTLHMATPLIAAGTSNEAVIDPPVPVPSETPCAVTLYKSAVFGANNVNFTYAPPAGCAGPWAKVVLQVDVGLDAGIQYDRTGLIVVAGVPLWFGTTAEPNPGLGPHWHFERDVTDYTATLASSQPGFVIIGNYTNPTDTSVITSSARLLFYPATAAFPAPRTPDQVIALAPPGGGTAGLGTPTDTLTITPTLPRNIIGASLDVYLQGQSGDEFWYTCVPNEFATILESCGGGSFREGEIAIDGTPAGVAPVYPWIFTGGIDPYLWAPIPGVQTLDFKPFRVELSPFAGLLSDGQPHSLSLSLAGANNYFSVTGALFLYLDHHAATVTGAVTRNTLAAAPSPITTNTIATVGTKTNGAVKTVSRRAYTISGYTVGSQGRIDNTVQETSDFTSKEDFQINNVIYRQSIAQLTQTTVQATSTGGAAASGTASYTYPLAVDLLLKGTPAGNIAQTTNIDQRYSADAASILGGGPALHGHEANMIHAQDELIFDQNFNVLGNKNQKSRATYKATGPGGCVGRNFAAANSILTSAQYGCP